MKNVTLSNHAVQCFAGNLSWSAACDRLRRMLRRVRFLGVRPGKARLYALREIRFIVQDATLITVYRQTYSAAPATEDLWCLSVCAP